MLLATISEAVQAADRLVGSRYPQRSSKSNNHIDVFLIALATWHLWVWLFVPLRSVSRPDLVATLPLPILSVDAAAVSVLVVREKAQKKGRRLEREIQEAKQERRYDAR